MINYMLIKLLKRKIKEERKNLPINNIVKFKILIILII
jgi:hypothetical protein